MNLTLTYETIWTRAGSGLLIALEKFDLPYVTNLVTLVLVM